MKSVHAWLSEVLRERAIGTAKWTADGLQIGPIINADGVQRVAKDPGASAHHAKQRVFAHGQHQPLRKAGGRPTAKRQTEMMDDVVEPRSTSRQGAKVSSAKRSAKI
jgi:hypothetical protein